MQYNQAGANVAMLQQVYMLWPPDAKKSHLFCSCPCSHEVLQRLGGLVLPGTHRTIHGCIRDPFQTESLAHCQQMPSCSELTMHTLSAGIRLEIQEMGQLLCPSNPYKLRGWPCRGGRGLMGCMHFSDIIMTLTGTTSGCDKESPWCLLSSNRNILWEVLATLWDKLPTCVICLPLFGMLENKPIALPNLEES